MAIKDFFGFLRKKKIKKSRSRKKVKHTIKKARKTTTKKRQSKSKKGTKKRVLVKKRKVVAVVTHRFSKIKVAILKVRGKIKVGDKLHFKGHTTNFKQKVSSMQINHVPIKSASVGQEIGLRVKSRVRINDKVFLE